MMVIGLGILALSLAFGVAWINTRIAGLFWVSANFLGYQWTVEATRVDPQMMHRNPPRLGEISKIAAPTATVSPSATSTLVIVPASGLGTGMVALSVSISIRS